jgi:putative ABC transport system permease protein
MIKNYLKIAIRNLVKQRGLAFINIVGLSAGLACFCLFMLYAINEFSYDRFHKNEKDIYRVYEMRKESDGNDFRSSVSMPMPLGPAMKRDLPDVINYVRVRQASDENILRTKNGLHRVKLSYADPQFFSVFSFPLKYGNSFEPLQNINGLVITETKAKELFGKDKALGETVEIKVEDKFQPFVITGIAMDIPANSSIVFEALGNFLFMESTKFGGMFNNWYTDAFRTYVQLNLGSKLPHDEQLLQKFYQTYTPDEKLKADISLANYGLQPLRSIHTDTKITDSSGVESVNPKTIWIILAIAFGVLLIACINFTTLAIGRSADRRKEVGVRKVLGAERRQIILQFISEALIISITSALIGLLLVKLLLHYFNSLTGRNLEFSFSLYPELSWYLAGLVLLVGLMAGSYPALVLSGFKSIDVFKNKLLVRGSNLFTKSLVSLQFALSFGLIVSTIIILQQTKYLSSKNPGFQKDNVIVVDASETDSKKIYPLIRQALLTQPGIIGIAASQRGLGDGGEPMNHGFQYNGTQKNVYEIRVDSGYIEVLGMQILSGRNFNAHIAEDSTHSVIINEAMVNDFGWTLKDAIGQQIKGFTNNLTPVVIGVVKDFNFQSLSKKVHPHLFQMFHGQLRKIFIRIKPGTPEPALSFTNQLWNRIVPDVPFKYTFLDEDLNNFYKSERRWSSIVGWAGGISIFLACLGLFGLAALAAINRTKEIGIRKVLGASLSVIVALLAKDFLKLVMVAVIIATPLSWYFMHKWLQDFAYRITISWWVFVAAGVAAVLIAFATVSFQVIKAAIANPVKSLRTE